VTTGCPLRKKTTLTQTFLTLHAGNNKDYTLSSTEFPQKHMTRWQM